MSVEMIECYWERLLSALQGLDDRAELDEFLKLFLTPEERDSMSMRIALIGGLLVGGLTQREMSKELGISIAKITRGSNALKQVSPGFKDKLMTLLSEKK